MEGHGQDGYVVVDKVDPKRWQKRQTDNYINDPCDQASEKYGTERVRVKSTITESNIKETR